LEAWTASLTAGHARPYGTAPVHEALAIVAGTLEPPQARISERERVEAFVDANFDSILKPLQVASIRPDLMMPREVANRLGVNVDLG
jgi:hypothetical protein